MDILRNVRSARLGGGIEGIAAPSRQQGWLWPLSVALILMLLSGCAAFRGGPKQLSDAEKDVKPLKKYFHLEILEKYDALDNTQHEKEKRLLRNEIINGRRLAIDLFYNDFKQNLYTEGVGSHVGFDLTTITLGVAGALSSGGTSQVLSGIQAGVSGLRVSIDKNLFYEKTMPALLGEMDAQRLTVLSRICLGLDQDVVHYPLAQGLVDVEAYYVAGTIPGAVASIVKSSGEKAGKAEAFIKERQDRVEALLSLIDSLTDGQAIALEKNPPERDPEAEKLVQATDPQNLRETKGFAAKQALKKRVLYGERSPEKLNSWEAAINAIKK